MSTEQATGAIVAKGDHVETVEPATTSEGNSTVLSVVLFALLFVLFAGGLYVLSLFTPVTFIVGLAMVLLSLYLTFDTVPRFLV